MSVLILAIVVFLVAQICVYFLQLLQISFWCWLIYICLLWIWLGLTILVCFGKFLAWSLGEALPCKRVFSFCIISSLPFWTIYMIWWVCVGNPKLCNGFCGNWGWGLPLLYSARLHCHFKLWSPSFSRFFSHLHHRFGDLHTHTLEACSINNFWLLWHKYLGFVIVIP